jgi:phosphatidylglycerophosphatase A
LNLRKFFLTLGYSGLSPKAPGTVGSFISLLLVLPLMPYLHVSTIFLISLLISAVAVKQIDIYEKEVGEHDSKEIVIDELAGMWITISICWVNNADMNTMILISALAFFYFRLFDIWKPSLIGKIDRDIKGGWGVMGDDILAGIAAGVATSGTYKLIGMFLV